MALRFITTRANPGLLTLPWHLSLDEWGDDVVVPLPRGLSRHIVRIVRVGDDVYAVKQTREHLTTHEYRLLRDLQKLGLPTVAPIGVVSGRTNSVGEEIEPALVTRHLEYSLPYRSLFSHGLPQESLPKVVDALVVLLVRLHLSGFFWGDVSLSNVLFRRSAGEFSAYLVDAETGELHENLSDGQRAYDLDLALTNIYGELLDLQEGRLLKFLIPSRRHHRPRAARLPGPVGGVDRHRGVQRRRVLAHGAEDRTAQHAGLRHR